MNLPSAHAGIPTSKAPGQEAGTPLRASWLAWSLWLVCTALAAVSLSFALLNGRTPVEIVVNETIVTIATLAVTFSVVGALIAARRPENPIGWIFCVAALCQGLIIFAEEYATYALVVRPGALPLGAELSWLKEWIWAPGLGLIVVFLPLLFPDGRPPSRRWRGVAWLGALSIVLIIGLYSVLWSERGPALMQAGGEAEAILAPGAALIVDVVAIPLMLVAGLAAVISLVVRFRRSRAEERQQIKWFTAAAVVTLAFVLVFEELPTVEGSLLEAVLAVASVIVTPVLPIATGVAILKHRLYDIDLIINRTLVYGILTACIVGIYVLVVGSLGAVFHTGNGLVISLAAAGFVAVLFSPLRERLQGGVNRLMYGERDEPYTVISRLGRRLAETPAPEAVLPAIVESVGRAFRLPRVEIWLVDGGTVRLGAAHGASPSQTSAPDPGAVDQLRHATDRLDPAAFGESSRYGTLLRAGAIGLVLPLTHQGELVGALCLAPRGPGEDFSPEDRRLLRDLATQAGAAAHAVRLTAALRTSLENLRRSRERLVAAQEEERRRIQRDLHDGLGPVLASMRLRLEACLDAEQEARPVLFQELERLYELVGQATADIRRLVYDLRPPVLDQLGLVAALRQHCDRVGRETGIAVCFEADDMLRIPAAAEVALLRVAQEALVNVSKHAQATQVDVQLGWSGGDLVLSIRDDGVGFEADGHEEGTGIGSMRERAEALGGRLCLDSWPGTGTKVTVYIPAER